MLDIFIERLRQKKRTVGFPAIAPLLPPRFRGRPCIDSATCAGARGKDCRACADVCPVEAIVMEEGVPALDMGICTFCGSCAAACPEKALIFTNDWRLGSTRREALIIRPFALPLAEEGKGLAVQSFPPPDDAGEDNAGRDRDQEPERPHRSFLLPPLPITPCREAGGAFARSFRLRQVTAAGCGACEADLNVLTTVVFDLGRFGMDFVASPRHADGLVLTGPLPRNMREATQKCLNAMARPKTVIAVGACAISGGLFRSLPGRPSAPGAEGARPHLEPDLFIPGCPPHPYTSLDALLRFIGLAVPGE